MVGILYIHFLIPMCRSLKEKRSLISPILARLHKEFNISAAELDDQDSHRQCLIACCMVANNPAFIQKALQAVLLFFENHYPDCLIFENKIEILN